MKPADPALSRRSLMRLGVGAGIVFAVGGAAAWLWRPGLDEGRLTASGRRVFGAVARAVLEGSLPHEREALDRALDAHLDHLEATLAAFPVSTQAEVGRLVALLSVAPVRRWLATLEPDWHEAGVIELAAALRRMRADPHTLRQQAYHALRDLTNAAFYARSEHWSLLGYPGPVEA